MKILIIGGGASGTACAVKTKQLCSDAEVMIIERLGEMCKKIYATGNGRCNLSNTAAPNCKKTAEFFSSIGVKTRADNAGRVYPYSERAETVAESLTDACKKYGVKIITDCCAEKAEYSDGIYNVYTNKGKFSGDVLVLASGGKSQSKLGSNGSGYSLAADLGLGCGELEPGLVQLVSPDKACRRLKGMRAKGKIKIVTNGETAGEEYGEILFTDYGLSGIAAMNLSLKISENRIKSGKDKTFAEIDFVPDMTVRELMKHYGQFGTFGGIAAPGFCRLLERESNGNPKTMAKLLKSRRFEIIGTKGFDFAQITKGGIKNSFLTPSGESKSMPGLYAVGELTDHQYECGGFNLDFAFSSGIRAAKEIVKKYAENK